MKKIAQEIVETFAKVKPAWKPPHETVFEIAKKYGKPAFINGKPQTWWTFTRIEQMFNMQDDALNDLNVKIGDEAFKLEWFDCRKVEVIRQLGVVQ